MCQKAYKNEKYTRELHFVICLHFFANEFVIISQIARRLSPPLKLMISQGKLRRKLVSGKCRVVSSLKSLIQYLDIFYDRPRRNIE